MNIVDFNEDIGRRGAKREYYQSYGTIFPRKKGYRFYDTPDGKDFGEKLYYTTGLAAKFAVPISSAYALFQWGEHRSFFWYMYHTSRYCVPFFVFSSVFTIGTYTTANIREKDDEYNSAVGGGLAGLALAVWFKRPVIGPCWSALTAYICAMKKVAVMAGIPIPSEYRPIKRNSAWTRRNLDFSLMKDVPDAKPW